MPYGWTPFDGVPDAIPDFSWGGGTISTPDAPWEVTSANGVDEQVVQAPVRGASVTPSKKEKKAARWEKIKAWWRELGPDGLAQFASAIGQGVGAFKAARDGTEQQGTGLGDLESAYREGEGFGQETGEWPTAWRMPLRGGSASQSFPWWIVVLILVILAVVTVAILARRK